MIDLKTRLIQRADECKDDLYCSFLEEELREAAKRIDELESEIDHLKSDLCVAHQETQAAMDAAADLPSPPAASDGVSLIAAERRRQSEVEGYTEEHNDRHDHGQMAISAAAYALLDTSQRYYSGWLSTWGSCRPLKPKDPIRNLVRAGALIAAEIDRLRRLEAGVPPAGPSR